jgi:hypothetical protein
MTAARASGRGNCLLQNRVQGYAEDYKAALDASSRMSPGQAGVAMPFAHPFAQVAEQVWVGAGR